MSFIDDDDREEKRRRNHGQWRDPERPVSEQQIQNWQMRPQQPPAQQTPEEQMLSDTARRMQPDMEAAGFTNPFAYVAHLGARRSSDPREARMQEMFRREVVPGAMAGGRRDGAAGDDRGQFVQVQNRVDMPKASSSDRTDGTQSSTSAGHESLGRSGGAPVVEPEIGGNPEPLSPTERRRLIENTMLHEGGINDSPSDPGNRGGTITNRGITQDALDSYRRKNPDAGYPARTSDLTREQTIRLYDEIYLRQFRIEEIADPRLRRMVFDMAVNSGYSNAIGELQTILNRHLGTPIDSRKVLGSGMIATLNDLVRRKQYSALAKLAQEFHYARLDFIAKIVKENPDLERFERGWIARAKDFEPLRDPFFYQENSR